jgi:ATP-binding cassette subfamily F protein uup
MDRLCTAVVGLDGRGGSAPYGSVGQWLAAYEPPVMEYGVRGKEARRAPRAAALPPKKKLSFREQQEWDGMEAAIMAAEVTMAARQAEVERAAAADHAALAAACRELEASQQAVERLYARWQELEAKRA